MFKNGSSKICGRQPLKNVTWSILEYVGPNFTWPILEYVGPNFTWSILDYVSPNFTWSILEYVGPNFTWSTLEYVGPNVMRLKDLPLGLINFQSNWACATHEANIFCTQHLELHMQDFSHFHLISAGISVDITFKNVLVESKREGLWLASVDCSPCKETIYQGDGAMWGFSCYTCKTDQTYFTMQLI